ncbi:right-handed parallel beta-helix repeat-containing protein [Halobacillus yeomjeoni]|uniref:Right-handed parallel beta-helix repeat-containing protein n=1 Tax=Halobacillus yeomjeoni TaxID=311194 RepID=A0A931HXT8_9BACI|nr:right-handed parallel beta-helix repeat-containing protein [Halobacillus yeomjeoni]MBH0231399.1 right-handed parallel beta-helix repeat-containing protein [Halobacillus yeomjeoni]
MTEGNLTALLQKLFERWQEMVQAYHDDLLQITSPVKNAETEPRVIRVPKDYPTITKAVEGADAGDTILVANGSYHESITVPASKNSLRIIADGRDVKLIGKGNLDKGFTLMADNVEVNGFVIHDFLNAGIEVTGVYGVKMIRNTIDKVRDGHGIKLDPKTFSNLIWKNKISRASQDGIHLQSKNVWVAGNEISENGHHGVHIRTVGNHVVGNTIAGNKKSGMREDEGFNLLFGNDIKRNGKEGIDLTLGIGGSMSIGNLITRNRHNGIHMETEGNTALDNEIKNNQKAGVKISSSFNVIELNRIFQNWKGGIVLQEDASNNLIFRNTFLLNRGASIHMRNEDNTMLQNYKGPFDHKLSTPGYEVIHVPKDFPTISEAVDAASPGTTILVEDGVYRESIKVPLEKSGVRIIAGGKEVILDGEEELDTAFDLSCNLVQIFGFRIQNYRTSGISVKGIGISLLENKIENITEGSGIQLSLAFSTLMWKNTIRRAEEHGVTIKAMNTWLIENEMYENGGDGIHFEGSTTVGSTITRNCIHHNAHNGIADEAGFNFIYNNQINNNGKNGVHEQSGLGSGAVIENHFRLNQNGVQLDNDAAQVAGNKIEFNKNAGVLVQSDFNNLEENEITVNHETGVTLTEAAEGNLLIRNVLKGSVQLDILSENPSNAFVENRCGKSEPPGICDGK